MSDQSLCLCLEIHTPITVATLHPQSCWELGASWYIRWKLSKSQTNYGNLFSTRLTLSSCYRRQLGAKTDWGRWGHVAYISLILGQIHCHSPPPPPFSAQQGCWISEAKCTLRILPRATSLIPIAAITPSTRVTPNLGPQPRSLSWTPKYHMLGCLIAGSPVKCPHSTTHNPPPPRPPPMFPNPMERTVIHYPGAQIQNPCFITDLSLLFSTYSTYTEFMSCLSPRKAPVSPSTLLILQVWPLSPLT